MIVLAIASIARSDDDLYRLVMWKDDNCHRVRVQLACLTQCVGADAERFAEPPLDVSGDPPIPNV